MDNGSNARRNQLTRRSHDDVQRAPRDRRSHGGRQSPASVSCRHQRHDGHHRRTDERDRRRHRHEDVGRDVLAGLLRREDANRQSLLRSRIAAETALRSDIAAQAAADQADPRRVELRMEAAAAIASNAARIAAEAAAAKAIRRDDRTREADRLASHNRALAVAAADAGLRCTSRSFHFRP